MMQAPPPSTRALFTGSTGSGKSYWLRRLFAERWPRVLVLDYLGREWPAWSEAQVCDSIPTLHQALERSASQGRWRIVFVTGPDSPEADALVSWLSPAGSRKSFSRGVGGMALVCDECDYLAPNQQQTPGLSLWQRGRHDGLSIFAATQRLPLVSRVVSAQTRYFGLCKQHEARDLDSLDRFLPPDVMAAARVIPKRELVLFDHDRQVGTHYSEQGKPLAHFGEVKREVDAGMAASGTRSRRVGQARQGGGISREPLATGAPDDD